MLTKHLLRGGRVLFKGTRTILFKRTLFADGKNLATANDLPIPGGDFLDWYAKRNAKLNTILASGALALASSLYVLFTNERIYWNYSIPDYDD